MPPGFKPRGKDFPRRNRIIAGLSLGILVVEAARRSGTLITARLAGELGREVFAVPGHPLDPRAAGTNHLLKTGATLVTSANDILEAINPMLEMGMGTSGTASGLRRANSRGGRTDCLEEAAQAMEPLKQQPPSIADDERSAVAQVLGPAPIKLDEIARAAALPIRVVQTVLMELDLAGLVERHGQQMVSLRPNLKE